jgi:transcriptional regulator with XRE-family HTH domain
MAEGPTVRRRRLGAELRRLREDHGRKLEDVAAELGLVASTLSRIETGKAPIRTNYLRQLLDMYDVYDKEQQQVLIDMAREGHRRGWWADYDDVLPSGFDIYMGLEAEAATVRSYHPEVITGLLQTRAYALEIVRAIRPKFTDDQVEKAVDLRMQRQQLVENDPPLEVWAILGQGALMREVGGAAVRRAQLEHLLEACRWPNVTLQVLAWGCGAHAGMEGSFNILEFRDHSDPHVAYSEGVDGVTYLEKEREVRIRAEAFDQMRAAALSPPASADLIRLLIADMGRV